MTLPPPTCTFTIPSIHDDTPLDCRIYHPAGLSLHLDGLYGSSRPPKGWRKRGAIIAHPYAPMGGSYDDPVVAAAGKVLLEKGFVVGTFNFRGAGCSKGRTSWTSKAELADYTSFAGFLIHYLYYLEPRRLEPSTAPSPGGLEGHPLEPIASALPLAIEPTSFPFDSNSEPLTTLANDEKTLLILGGYSYGSLIATRLPPTPSIITSTTNGDVSGSPQSEILLRAHHCAAEWNREAAMPSASPLKTENGSRRRSGAYQPHHHSPRGVVIGGEEGEPGRRKPSREFRRSLEIGRLSVELPVIPSPSKRKSADLRRRSYHFSPDNSLSSSTSPSRVPGLPSPTPHSIQTAYLLISPLLPPISHLATFSFFSPSQKPTTTTTLTTNPTLAIYGTHDVFTSHGKLKRWAEEMAAEAGRGGGVGGGGRGQFRNVAVEGAGHFWVEEKVLEGGLRGEIGLWVDDLMVDWWGCQNSPIQ